MRSSPIWPAGRGRVEISACISPLPLEDPLVLVGLPLQPQGVLAQGLRVVELVVDELDQAVQLSSWLQGDQFADRAANRRCLEKMVSEYWNYKKEVVNPFKEMLMMAHQANQIPIVPSLEGIVSWIVDYISMIANSYGWFVCTNFYIAIRWKHCTFLM